MYNSKGSSFSGNGGRGNGNGGRGSIRSRSSSGSGIDFSSARDFTIGIIGYGRFGRLLEWLFANLTDAEIKIFSHNQQKSENFFNLDEVLTSDLIIPAVPISEFTNIVNIVKTKAKPNSVLLDVCSVKMHTQEIMLEILADTEIQLICSHPMFGPSNIPSYQQRNTNSDKILSELQGLNFVIHNLRAEQTIYTQIMKLFSNWKLTMVEMTPSDHDKIAAQSQFLSLFTAFMLKQLNLEFSKIDTKSASILKEFVNMINVDKSLLKDIYDFNPHCESVLNNITSAQAELVKFLKPGT